MSNRYIIYCPIFDKFLSFHERGDWDMSEFPGEYMVFDRLEDAEAEVDSLINEFNLGVNMFEIEVL